MRTKVKFQELVNGHFVHWHPLEAFEVFRWMIKTGNIYQRNGYGVFECLYRLGGKGAINYPDSYGFYTNQYKINLQLSFVAALFDDKLDVVNEWRKANNIYINKYKMLKLNVSPNYKSHNDAVYALNTMLYAYGHDLKLKKSLNKYYAQAIDINSVRLSTDGEEWRAILYYGFDGCEWSVVLGRQGNSSFSDFLIKSGNKFSKLVVKE